MLVKHALSYVPAAKPSKLTREGVRVISEMTTPRILCFVAVKHRVGLLFLSTFLLGAYIVYDKLVHLFI